MLPQALLSRPKLTRDSLFYLEAFFFLSGFRSYGMSGPLPIALSEIAEYARLVGYNTSDDILFFVEIVHACDMVYLRKAAEDQKASAAASKPKAGRR